MPRIHPSTAGTCCTLIVAAWLFNAAVVSAQDLTIAAASDLQGVLPQVISEFEKTGQTARVTFGSSGNFFSQIQNGAPFDIFFSADIDYPKQLEAASLAEAGTLYEYAVGKIVLWAPKGGAVDPRQGLRALLDPNVRHIAIANPEHAPYGRAAVAALRSADNGAAIPDHLHRGGHSLHRLVKILVERIA